MGMLVVNADDFGLAPGVNEGIIEAHRSGIVTSTSLMVHRPAAVQAVELARANTQLSVGLHFEEGDGDLDDPNQAKRQFEEQLKRFRQLLAADPTHVDSHHHVHLAAERLQTFIPLVAPLAIPLRGAGQVSYIGGFYGRGDQGAADPRRISRPFLIQLVAGQATGEFAELACHPGRITGDFSSSYLWEREVELETLTSPGLRDAIEALGVQLVSYRAWPG